MPLSSHQCRGCGTEIAGTLLSCPSCGWLVYAGELKRLADTARSATTRADALAAWRNALALLPPDTRQAQAIVAEMDRISRAPEAPVSTAPVGTTAVVPADASQKPRRTGILAGAGVVAALLAKFKFVIVFALTKLKFLLLGLSKAGTLFSMLLSFAVYWNLWGWKFAAGFIGSIYIHEMGHVAMLRSYGIPASAPMFIPGVGAVVRLRMPIPTAVEDARIGLAGPIWGLGAALAAWGLSAAFQSPMMGAIARTGAWINLFNLIPVWQLDGSRGFRALSRVQRWIAVGVLAAAYFLTFEGLLLILTVVAGVRAMGRDADPQGDLRTLLEFSLLIGSLSALTLV